MISSFSKLGLETGTIKEVSLNNEEDNKTELEKTILIFRRWFAFAAILGVVLCISFSPSISKYLFNDTNHVYPIALLSICIFFAIITSGRASILQGMRKIPQIAKSNIFESFIGLIAIIGIYYYFGIEGIIPALILNSMILFACVNYFYRKVAINKQQASFKETIDKGLKSLRLGLFITLGGCIATLSMFAIRYPIIHYSSYVDGVGLYQAAWSISIVFVSFILGSAGIDFFSRLCSISDYNNLTRKLVNQQTYIIITISSPAIITIILFSYYILNTLYSIEFVNAQAMLQWQMAGVFFKILSTPIASILLAKKKGLLYLLSEFVFFAVYLLMSYLLTPKYDITGAGIAYFIAYITYTIILLIIGYSLSKFRWNKNVIRISVINAIIILIASLLIYIMPPYTILLSILVLMSSATYSIYCLSKIISVQQIKDWFGRRQMKEKV